MTIRAFAIGGIVALGAAMLATAGLFHEPDHPPERTRRDPGVQAAGLAWQSWQPVRPAPAVTETAAPPPAGEPPPAGLDPGIWATPATFAPPDQEGG